MKGSHPDGHGWREGWPEGQWEPEIRMGTKGHGVVVAMWFWLLHVGAVIRLGKSVQSLTEVGGHAEGVGLGLTLGLQELLSLPLTAWRPGQSLP